MRISYVVTGYHRSGTTMMTRAVSEASELEVVRSRSVEAIVRSREANRSQYDPNPNGYYMPPRAVLPHNVPGKLIKTPLYQWQQIEPGNYLVVLIERLPQERALSWQKAFGFAQEDPVMIEQNELGLANLLARTDVKLARFRYHEVIQEPLRHFKQLKAQGWPIDPNKAASLVDPRLYRNRI